MIWSCFNLILIGSVILSVGNVGSFVNGVDLGCFFVLCSIIVILVMVSEFIVRFDVLLWLFKFNLLIVILVFGCVRLKWLIVICLIVIFIGKLICVVCVILGFVLEFCLVDVVWFLIFKFIDWVFKLLR